MVTVCFLHKRYKDLDMNVLNVTCFHVYSQQLNRRMSVEELTPVKDLLCPVCNITGFQNQKLLQKHVDEHFNDGV